MTKQLFWVMFIRIFGSVVHFKYLKLFKTNTQYHTKKSNRLVLQHYSMVEYLTDQALHMFRSWPTSAPEHNSPTVWHPHLPPPEADALPEPLRWGQWRLLPPLPPHAGAGCRRQPWWVSFWWNNIYLPLASNTI